MVAARIASGVVGKQEMVGAIDAVCDVVQRIICKLKEGAGAGGPSLPWCCGHQRDEDKWLR
jgi:DNA topoisomerase III